MFNAILALRFTDFLLYLQLLQVSKLGILNCVKVTLSESLNLLLAIRFLKSADAESATNRTTL